MFAAITSRILQAAVNIPDVNGRLDEMLVDPAIPLLGKWLDATDQTGGVSELTFLEQSAASIPIGVYDHDGVPLVLLNDPRFVSELFMERRADFHKGPVQQATFRALLGRGISVSEGQRHRVLRTLLAPLFGRQKVNGFAEEIIRQTATAADAWLTCPEIDLFSELHRLTVRTFGLSLLAVDHLWQPGSEFDTHRQSVWQWMNDVANKKQAPTRDRSVSEAPISDSVAVLQATIEDSLTYKISRDDSASNLDLAGRLIQAYRRTDRPIDLVELRDQVIGFMLAAHETSATGLFWSLYLLDQSPDIMSRLRTEIDSVLNGRPVSVADVPRLPYTQKVIREALRLYPPAGRQFRCALRDTQLGDYRILKGTSIIISHYLLHRNEQYFPLNRSCRPGRETGHIPPCAYMPFGAGRRVCLGRQYALLEMQFILVTLLQTCQFTFLSHDTVRPTIAITLRPDRKPRVVAASYP